MNEKEAKELTDKYVESIAKANGYDSFAEYTKEIFMHFKEVAQASISLWECGGRGDTPLPMMGFTDGQGNNFVVKIVIEEEK